MSEQVKHVLSLKTELSNALQKRAESEGMTVEGYLEMLAHIAGGRDLDRRLEIKVDTKPIQLRFSQQEYEQLVNRFSGVSTVNSWVADKICRALKQGGLSEVEPLRPRRGRRKVGEGNFSLEADPVLLNVSIPLSVARKLSDVASIRHATVPSLAKALALSNLPEATLPPPSL